jgi:hypothetical protein
MSKYVEFKQPNPNLSTYRLDDRVTVAQSPKRSVSANIFDGPTLLAASGIRVNNDASGLYEIS